MLIVVAYPLYTKINSLSTLKRLWQAVFFVFCARLQRAWYAYSIEIRRAATPLRPKQHFQRILRKGFSVINGRAARHCAENFRAAEAVRATRAARPRPSVARKIHILRNFPELRKIYLDFTKFPAARHAPSPCFRGSFAVLCRYTTLCPAGAYRALRRLCAPRADNSSASAYKSVTASLS